MATLSPYVRITGGIITKGEYAIPCTQYAYNINNGWYFLNRATPPAASTFYFWG